MLPSPAQMESDPQPAVLRNRLSFLHWEQVAHNPVKRDAANGSGPVADAECN